MTMESKTTEKRVTILALIFGSVMLICGYFASASWGDALRNHACEYGIEESKIAECKVMAASYADVGEWLRIGGLVLIPTIWIVALVVIPKLSKTPVNKKGGKQ